MNHGLLGLLGQETTYPNVYNPQLLFPIPRKNNREALGLNQNNLPFYGQDTWHHYEVSWLKNNGVPEVAIARIVLPCESLFLIESKSMKLYFNSLNMAKFDSREQVLDLIIKDLSEAAKVPVQVEFLSVEILPEILPEISQKFSFGKPIGECLDNLNIDIKDYEINKDLLKIDLEKKSHESLYSNLFRSRCPVTSQPDWAAINIIYKGPKIIKESLLAYLISYREHMGFHEDCVERIFIDLYQIASWDELTVMGYFTRRGGLDINPVRILKTSENNKLVKPIRLFRQ